MINTKLTAVILVNRDNKKENNTDKWHTPHTLSSLRIDKQTVPDGYTFGWKKPCGNLHFGGLLG